MKDKKFLGSNIAMVIGILEIITGLTDSSDLLFTGICIVLGAWAYKSLKKRQLGISTNTKTKFILEITL